MWFPVIFCVLRMRDQCYSQSRCVKCDVYRFPLSGTTIFVFENYAIIKE
jgi:hypothetical protein